MTRHWSLASTSLWTVRIDSHSGVLSPSWKGLTFVKIVSQCFPVDREEYCQDDFNTSLATSYRQGWLHSFKHQPFLLGSPGTPEEWLQSQPAALCALDRSNDGRKCLENCPKSKQKLYWASRVAWNQQSFGIQIAMMFGFPWDLEGFSSPIPCDHDTWQGTHLYCEQKDGTAQSLGPATWSWPPWKMVVSEPQVQDVIYTTSMSYTCGFCTFTYYIYIYI